MAALQKALALQASGRLDEARSACRRILASAPATVDAWHLLAVVELQAGNVLAALAAMDRAIGLAPAMATLYATRARVHERAGGWPTALADCAEAVRLDPKLAEAWLTQARVCRKTGDTAQALVGFDRYLALRPGDARVWFNRGNALNALGRLAEAIDSYARSTALQPDFPDAAFNLGTALLADGQGEAAVRSFQQLLARHPGHVDGWVNLGNAWRSVAQDEAAAEAYRQALALMPGRADAHNNLASIALAAGRIDAALEHFDAALAREPGQVIFALGKASALKQQGRLDEALRCFDQAVAVAPQHVEAHTSRSLCLLLAGRLAEGFREYEWRWQAPDLADIRPDYRQPCWLGREDIRGKRLLVRWEQGFGDTIQFCRYVAQLNALGAQVILQLQAPLLPLMQGLRGQGVLLADHQPPPDFDYYVPMLSLPLALGTTLASIPAVDRYISPNAERLAIWRERLGKQNGLRIGLAWSGRPQHKNDSQRSLLLAEFINALPDGAEYFVLQKDVRSIDVPVLSQKTSIRNPAADFSDFADTAAVCELMDLVISVDTSIAHLAGALGRPLFLILPFIPDWRWLLGHNETPWYPSARLFRQDERRDWLPVLQKIRALLTQKLNNWNKVET